MAVREFLFNLSSIGIAHPVIIYYYFDHDTSVETSIATKTALKHQSET